MAKTNLNLDNHNFSELINRLEGSGSRIVIEQEGNAIAALITYADLKRLEALEAILLKKAEQEEYEWLKAAMRNPAFDFLKDSEEDIYTLADGKPFHDPEWAKSVISDPEFISPTDSEEGIYTLADGKPFHDEG